MGAMAETPPALQNDSPRKTIPWATLGWLTLMVAVLYLPVLITMVKEWSDEEDMGHGFFVLPVVAYIIWQRRDELAQIQIRPSWWGYVLIVWGFCQLLAGTLGADFFVMRTALVVSILGVLLATCGWPLIKALAMPLFLLLFMIRIPLFIYSQITFPLQLFASRVAEASLSILGIPVLREGNILELTSQRLSVIEACSGIRSLLSLAFLSLVYGYFFDDRQWMKWFLLVATVPIAILANASRVTITALLSEVNPELAQGAYHTFEGWVIFMVALTALIITHKIVSWLLDRFHTGVPKTPEMRTA